MQLSSGATVLIICSDSSSHFVFACGKGSDEIARFAQPPLGIYDLLNLRSAINVFISNTQRNPTSVCAFEHAYELTIKQIFTRKGHIGQNVCIVVANSQKLQTCNKGPFCPIRLHFIAVRSRPVSSVWRLYKMYEHAFCFILVWAIVTFMYIHVLT